MLLSSVPLSLYPSVLNSFLLFASLLLRAFALNHFFVPSCLCVLVLRFLSLIFVFSVSSRWFNFAFWAAVSLLPAMQMTKLAGGGSLPCSRRFCQIQRHAPSLPPSKFRHAAPTSRIPAVHSGGNLARCSNPDIPIKQNGDRCIPIPIFTWLIFAPARSLPIGGLH
jgi:hypothetical protein